MKIQLSSALEINLSIKQNGNIFPINAIKYYQSIFDFIEDRMV